MSKSQWKFNPRFTVLLAALVALCAGGLFFWHGVAVRRNAIALLHRADQLLQEGDRKGESRYLRSFLRLNPLDDDVLARLALTLDAAAKTPSDKAAAVQVMYQALAQPANEARADLVVRRLRLLWETGRWNDARDQAEVVLKQRIDRDDPLYREAKVIQALAEADAASTLPQAADWSRIVEQIISAIATNPPLEDHLALVRRLAMAYGDPSLTIVARNAADPTAGDVLLPMQDRLQRTTDALNQLVSRFPESGEAYLVRFRHRQQLGDDGAKADLDRAMELATVDSAVVWLGAGEYFSTIQPVTQSTLEQAENCYKRAVAAEPRDREAHLALANTYSALARVTGSTEHVDEAVAQLRTALQEIDEQDIDLNIALARLLHRANKDKESSRALETAARALNARTLQIAAPVRARALADIERLRGEVLADKGDFAAAINTLRRTVELERAIPPAFAESRGLENSPLYTQLLLADAYNAIGNPEQAATALEETLVRAPGTLEIQLSAARAWENAGRPDRANALYESLVSNPRARATMPMQVARLLASQIGRANDKARAAAELEELLRAAEQGGANQAEVALMRVNLALLQGDAEAAGRAIAAAESIPGLTPAQWRSIAVAYETLGNTEQADRVSQTLDQQGHLLIAEMLRAELLRRRGLLAEAEDHIVSSLDRLSPEDRLIARVELSRIAADRGRTTAARDYLAPNLEARTRDVGTIRQYALLSASLEDWAAVERAEELLYSIEGDVGTQWRYLRGLRLASTAQGPDDPQLAEAETQRKELERLRPGWHSALQLDALISEKRQDTAAAIAAYRAVIEQETDATQRSIATQRYLDLAFGVAQPESGESVSLPSAVLASPMLSFQAVAREVALGRTELAVARAQEVARQRPTDAMAAISLAQTLALAGRDGEAEASLRQALQIAPQSPTTWNSLLAFFRDANRVDAIRELGKQFESTVRFSEPQRTLFLCRLAEAEGNPAAAAQQYESLLQQFPDDANVLQQAVSFFAVRDDARAEALLRNMLESKPRDVSIRRTLARLLAMRGDAASLQGALKLLSGEHGQLPKEDADRRLYAELLARTGNADMRRQAIGILMELQRGVQSPPSQDVIGLASLYEAEGRYPEAVAQLSDLVGRPNPASAHVTALADFLLRYKEAASPQYAALADSAIKRLESVQPSAAETIALRVRWLAASSESDTVASAISAYTHAQLQRGQDDETRAEMLRYVGAACQEVQQPQLAEDYFRQAAATHPSKKSALAQFLANRDDDAAIAEAIALCDELIAADPRDAAAVTALCNALGKADPSMAQSRQALLDQVLQANRDNVAVLQGLAGLRYRQHDMNAVIELLRRITTLEPSNLLAQNNLAYALALDGALDEAEGLIRRVLATAGAVATYRDTHGLVLLLQGRDAEALPLFEELARRNPSSSAILGHLAVAQHRTGKTEDAMTSYEAAVRTGLDVERLPQAEQQLFAEFRR